MSRLDRDSEPQLLDVGSPDDEDLPAAPPPRRRNAWLRSVIIVLLLSSCGVAGYYIADSLYRGSSTSTPAAPPEPAPVTPTETVETPTPAVPATPTAPNAGPTVNRVGEWNIVCPSSTAPRTDCALVQRLVDVQKRPVMVWSITRDTDGTVRAMWQTLPAVDRKAGLVLDAGDGRSRTVPFAACTEQYCLVRGILAPNYLTTLGTSPQVSVTIRNAQGAPTTQTFTMTGLAEGLHWLADQ